MTTSITWNIIQLDRNTADGVVFTVHYTVDAEDGTYRAAGAYGSVDLDQPDPDTMIPYADLTPEVVIQWTKDKLGEEAVATVVAALQRQIDEQHAPTKATGLPWAS